ncbi:MAG: single-stranded DNA-binding protein [Bacteroidales bacterium]|nr:single-stranded DNA-binding protein [Bacteroidales bacterium]
MAGINKVILVGNLGRDPEVRTLESGAKVARFTLATTESYKDRATGERKDVTEWHNIVCWRNLADIAEKYLSKGRQIYVEGRLRTRSWEDNGVKKFSTEINADNFIMLGKMENVPGTENAPQPVQHAPVTAETPPFLNTSEEDELPF